MKHKLQVWSTEQKRWRTAYARSWRMALHNARRLRAMGFSVRINPYAA